MGPANSLHASAYYSEYTERFDLRFGMLRMKIYVPLFQSRSKKLSSDFFLVSSKSINCLIRFGSIGVELGTFVMNRVLPQAWP